MLLGCIGDDFTGSSDLANTLTKQGMHTVQYTGVPEVPAAAHVEAGIVALKTRSIRAEDAVAQSLAALEWLRAQGCRQFFFKYCSTFDSTPEGNIGPVADALSDALGTDCVIVCPAFPATGRTLYQGHLFVNEVLLSESGMQNHPLTPMTDPDIRRWLASQTRYDVGHVPVSKVLAGATAIRAALEEQRRRGKRHIIVDAIQDDDLIAIGEAAADLKLVTGGSGVALGLPANFKKSGLISGERSRWMGEAGKCVALAGSCSNATRQQIEVHRQLNPVLEIVVQEVAGGRTTPDQAAAWLLNQPGIPLAYSSADPSAVASVHEQFGRELSAKLIEDFFSRVAQIVVAAGVRRLLVAGGETSGSVVEGLGLGSLEIGPEIDPGVPAMRARPDLVVALKSGNFGAPDYFAKAAGVLARNATS
ncbi:MAG: 3-oxo-tetronate kinase [Hyphomicrobiaceae bacterium]